MMFGMPCPICGSQTRSYRSLHRCISCEVCFNVDIAEKDDVVAHYQTEYHITKGLFATEHRRIYRIPEQIKLLAEISNHVAPPASILDIGCDKGFFLDEARRWGYSVHGIELSEGARKYCDLTGVPVADGLAGVKSKFNAVTMWHALEHIANPVELIGSIRNVLTEDGLLFVRVPDFDCLASHLLRDKWIWFQPRNHYFHYSQKALGRLLAVCGFKVIKIVSQRPNNIDTLLSFKVASSALKNHQGFRLSVRKKLGCLYETATGVELFCIASVS
jgi:2-polyprenyl-3-methyl-5-hydroxy-6-metoxy-1,4-benzoquinol methylase